MTMASEPYDIYIAGTAVRSRGYFEQEVTPPTDPPTYAAYDPSPGTLVVYEAVPQTGATITKVYTVDSEVTRAAAGIYDAIVVLPTPGVWYCGFRGPSGWVGRRKVLMTDPSIP
jgi:hypothetical protein